MKPARLAVLGVAILSGGAAALMMGWEAPPPPPPPVTQSVPMSDVLVAAGDLPLGQMLRSSDLRWQPWPAEAVPPGFIKRTDSPGAPEEITGAMTRFAFLAGEPIRREKLIKANGSGFMSAILPSGMRAVAISIDTRGATSAGGFILPNDRVDVILTRRDRVGERENVTSNTILTNVRVLAIDTTMSAASSGRSTMMVLPTSTRTCWLWPIPAMRTLPAPRPAGTRAAGG